MELKITIDTEDIEDDFHEKFAQQLLSETCVEFEFGKIFLGHEYIDEYIKFTIEDLSKKYMKEMKGSYDNETFEKGRVRSIKSLKNAIKILEEASRLG